MRESKKMSFEQTKKIEVQTYKEDGQQKQFYIVTLRPGETHNGQVNKSKKTVQILLKSLGKQAA